MLKLQQQENPKPNSDRTVSNTNAQEDGGNKNHSYDLVFPALPGSKTSEPKNIGINDQCASPKAPPKVQTSTVNNVIFYVSFNIYYTVLQSLLELSIISLYFIRS